VEPGTLAKGMEADFARVTLVRMLVDIINGC
jgi:hypothetical protein